jgi:hypothetical protein
MTGDYGCGKSSFALLLAHWFAGDIKAFPQHVRRSIEPQSFGVPRPQLLPVLVTCGRQPLGLPLVRALLQTLDQVQGRGPKPKLWNTLQHLSEAGEEPSDEVLFGLIQEVNQKVIGDSKAKGLLLILDELGKFLEFAALHPDRQDVFLLQRLAESAARSAEQPFFVVSLLHQGFNAYADHLSQSAQREWEKVAGRFEEIVFNPPFEQAAMIVASALGVRVGDLPPGQGSNLREAMVRTRRLGWLGSSSANALAEQAPCLYPLHPTVLPVLMRTFRRFGQNERSLFSFLLSNEPFGLQSFAQRSAKPGELYRLHHFYDYVRTNFGHRLSVQGYRSHWNLIDSVIESFSEENEVEIKVLKTLGVLNLLNEADLLATEDAVVCALGGDEGIPEKAVRSTLTSLRREKRVIYDRGRARGLCLWPHSSVDIEKAYEDACRAVESPRELAGHIKEYLDARPIVARRHYIETGNLRHAEVRYCSVEELPLALEDKTSDADGLILVPLCESPLEREEAVAFAKTSEVAQRSNWLLAVPQPLSNLASLLQELNRWEWVAANTLELNGDKYAREEVSRQKAAARAQLEKRIQDFVGLQQLGGQMMLDWFRGGRRLKIRNGRQLLETLSEVFEQTYPDAPQVQNELVNRRALSSAAAAARMRLIERMFAYANMPLLGMDASKKPPEMSMYLSVLRKTGLHREDEQGWHIGPPEEGADPCNVLPALRKVNALVHEKPDARVNVVTLFRELRGSTYGVRDGLIPILLSAYAIAHARDVAFYKDGSFLRELDGEQMLVLTKAPERFEIQYCRIEGVRAELFARMLAVLEIRSPRARDVELLDVVRSLCVFVAGLPAYARQTKRLSPAAIAVRDAILGAREPARLLFTELPVACGFDPIEAHSVNAVPIKSFVNTLKTALDEVRVAFVQLQNRMRKRLQDEFALSGSFEESRHALARRAQQIGITASEARFKAFCLRLMDERLPEPDWLESVGSQVAQKPPSKWLDADEDRFHSELTQVAGLFTRVESMAYAGGQSLDGSAVRLAVTLPSGVEHQQVIHFDAREQARVEELEQRFAALLEENDRLGLAAASRAIWSRLQKSGVRSEG